MKLKEKLINMTKKAHEDINNRVKKECLDFMPNIVKLMEDRAFTGKSHIVINFDIKYRDCPYFEVNIDEIVVRYDDSYHETALKQFLRSYFEEKKFYIQKCGNSLYIHW